MATFGKTDGSGGASSDQTTTAPTGAASTKHKREDWPEIGKEVRKTLAALGAMALLAGLLALEATNRPVGGDVMALATTGFFALLTAAYGSEVVRRARGR